VFNWYYRNDETMHVVYGTVWLDKGLPSERLIGPGDVVFFPAGSQACWHVETYFLKVAWSRRPLPAIVVAPLNLLRKFKKWKGAADQEPATLAGNTGGDQFRMGASAVAAKLSTASRQGS
jgi:hypothetical protein